ncbi:MAG: PilT/PilU family type 4a pilus ATPase [Planctomycetota bacterium]
MSSKNHESATENPDSALPAGPARLDGLLSRCVEQDASDIHLVEGLPPYLRSQGPLEPIADAPSMDHEAMVAIAEHLSSGFSKTYTGSVDGAFSAADKTRYRFNLYWRSGGLAIALRRLEDRFRSLKELGMPESLYNLCGLPNGLVVVSGPTGSGKSTTLATLIDRINQSHPCHVITIEDPVEYVHQPAKALVNQRQVGTDTASFNEALVASLREDPDVVLVGEVRDTDTIRTAITASETGHLVFTTVHAGDCVSTIERMVGVFPADEQPAIRQQLALVLRCVVAQRLLVADGPAIKAANAQEQARQRVVASEVLMVTPAVSNLMLQSKSSQIYSSMEAGGAQGMQTFEQDLARLLVEGRLSERSAIAAAKRPEVLRDRAEQAMRQNPAGSGGLQGNRRTPA